jgi:hypothetical protein
MQDTWGRKLFSAANAESGKLEEHETSFLGHWPAHGYHDFQRLLRVTVAVLQSIRHQHSPQAAQQVGHSFPSLCMRGDKTHVCWYGMACICMPAGQDIWHQYS